MLKTVVAGSSCSSCSSCDLTEASDVFNDGSDLGDKMIIMDIFETMLADGPAISQSNLDVPEGKMMPRSNKLLLEESQPKEEGGGSNISTPSPIEESNTPPLDAAKQLSPANTTDESRLTPSKLLLSVSPSQAQEEELNTPILGQSSVASAADFFLLHTMAAAASGGGGLGGLGSAFKSLTDVTSTVTKNVETSCTATSQTEGKKVNLNFPAQNSNVKNRFYLLYFDARIASKQK